MLKVTVGCMPPDPNGEESPENAEYNPDTAKQIDFEVTREKEQWFLGDEPFIGDIVLIRPNHYHIIWKNRSFNIEILESDTAGKSFQVLVNGTKYFTKSKDSIDRLLEGMGMQSRVVQKLNNVKAPMPGLIQSIAVNNGEEVSKGDTLFVLVAMKMENTIKAPGPGIIKIVKVAAGEIVEKNQVLLEFL